MMLTLFSTLTALGLLAGVTAAPTNITKRWSGKAGISWPLQEGTVAPLASLLNGDTNIAWWYNWNVNYDTIMKDASTITSDKFIPMSFNPGTVREGNPIQSGFSLFQGYNEPDHNENRLDVNTAASDWKETMKFVRGINPKVKFISPAVAGDFAWLHAFFDALCPGGLSNCAYKPDYLGVHAYDDHFAKFKTLVEKYHNEFGLDLVISEFACFNWGTRATPSQQAVHDFMGKATAWLDSTPWVYKYAWFGAVRNANSLIWVPEVNRLLDADGKITSLGEQYRGGGHQ